MRLKLILLSSLLTNFAYAIVSDDITLGGFIDTYYAYDFNAPKSHERAFTTQPVRHNEFNINLAYIEAVLKREKTRGRLALQHGHSVTKNSSGEPTSGATSGPNDTKMFQEAFVGTKIGENTWVDMGIFLGNIGSESWISKDNWTYTRALILDYVPYYSAGLRIDHQINAKQSSQLQILNGWGNMSENNQGKAIGMQFKNIVTDKFVFTYNNFFGDEEVVTEKPRFRQYHDFIFQWLASDEWQYLFAFDIGSQSQQKNNGLDPWYGTALTIRKVLNEMQAMALRAEYYNDRHQANITTNTQNGFKVTGLSINFDQKLEEKAFWRTELRGFYSADQIYPQGANGTNRLDGFLVTSLSISL